MANITLPRVALILSALLLAAFPLIGTTFYVQLGAKIMIMAIFALSLDLLVGHTGLVSLGHAAYFGLAAYVLALISPKYEAASLWVTLPAAIIAAAAVALVIGFLVVRTTGVYFIMVTLAFAQMLYSVFHDTKLGGGSDGIYITVRPELTVAGIKPLDLENPVQFYYFVLFFLFLFLLFYPYASFIHPLQCASLGVPCLSPGLYRKVHASKHSLTVTDLDSISGSAGQRISRPYWVFTLARFSGCLAVPLSALIFIASAPYRG